MCMLSRWENTDKKLKRERQSHIRNHPGCVNSGTGRYSFFPCLAHLFHRRALFNSVCRKGQGDPWWEPGRDALTLLIILWEPVQCGACTYTCNLPSTQSKTKPRPKLWTSSSLLFILFGDIVDQTWVNNSSGCQPTSISGTQLTP